MAPDFIDRIIITAPLQDDGSGAICQIILSKSEPVCFTQKGIFLVSKATPVQNMCNF